MLRLGFVCSAALAAFAGLCQASGTPTSPIDLNRYPPQPQATTCGDIVRGNLVDGYILYNASQVVDCLTSVPFNTAVALRFLEYLNTTLQFHATTAYLRDPPIGYQQPPIDLLGELRHIVDSVNDGAYHNQYAFEIAVQEMVQRVHDSHVTISGGISSVFAYFSPQDLVSVSVDGEQPPQIYIYEELVAQVSGSGVVASPIEQINGVAVVDYLMDYASRQTFGLLEPHADWNQLMYSPAQELFGLSSFSDAATFYPGDQFILKFENGTTSSGDSADGQWLAIYLEAGDTGPLETGGDFYNYFVLGIRPNATDPNYPSPSDAYDTSSDTSTPTPLTSWHDANSAYPSNTMSYQEDLGLFTYGSITGYFLPNSSTAVLSIPTFVFYDDGIDTFNQAIIDFVNNATQKNASNVIIDLQQNTGGLPGLALFVFNQFFPDITPYSGSQMRSHPLADVLGETSTAHFQQLAATNASDGSDGSDGSDVSDAYIEYLDYLSSEWVPVARINTATGQNFSSWQEFSGPRRLNGDTFSLTEEYDLSDQAFDYVALGDSVEVCTQGGACSPTPLWAAKDIVILTDGICGSTCALFVEMMHQAGVRSVAVGGNPKAGPMQAASGTRGAVQYSGDQLSDDFADVGNLNATAAALTPPALGDTGMQLDYTGFTLRSQLRRNATTPNQVLYMPADCRLYWTLANFHNYEQLWTDVYTAMFIDPSRCVAGSTNVTSPPARPPPAATQQTSSIAYYISRPFYSTQFQNDFEPMMDGPPSTPQIQFCTVLSQTCHNIPFACLNQRVPGQKDYDIVTRPCTSANQARCRPQQCQTTGFVNTDKRNGVAYSGRSTVTQGFCRPQWTRKNTQCSSIATESQLLSVLKAGNSAEEDRSAYY